MKKISKLSLLLLASFTLVTGCGEKEKVENKDNGTTPDAPSVNTNENVVKDQTLGVFKFENTSLVYQDGTSTLISTVTNTSSEEQFLREFLIHVKNEKGEEIVTLTGFVGTTIPAGETRTINSSYGDDLSKAASIEYELVK